MKKGLMGTDKYKWGTVKNIDVDKLPDDIKPFCKEEMTKGEVTLLGQYIIHTKINNFKQRVRGVFGRKKRK